MLIFVFRRIPRLWILFFLLNVIWIALARLVQPSLPDVIYASQHSLRLYIRAVNCSFVSFCEAERGVLDGMNPNPVSQLSPDGNYIAVYQVESWAIYPAGCLLGTENCAPFLLDDVVDTRLAWGPDGTTLAYMVDSAGSTMQIITRGCWDGSPPEKCLKVRADVLPGGVLRQPVWSADGRQIILAGLRPSGLFLLDAGCFSTPESCPEAITSLNLTFGGAYWPSFSPDASHLIYESMLDPVNGRLALFDLETGESELLISREGGVYAPTYSADGRYIAFAGFSDHNDNDLQIWAFDRQHQLTARIAERIGDDLTFPAWETGF